MAATLSAGNEIQGAIRVPEPADPAALRRVRLSSPMVAALLPWWLTLGPAGVAATTGRIALAGLLTAGGLLFSAAGVAAVLIAATHDADL